MTEDTAPVTLLLRDGTEENALAKKFFYSVPHDVLADAILKTARAQGLQISGEITRGEGYGDPQMDFNIREDTSSATLSAFRQELADLLWLGIVTVYEERACESLPNLQQCKLYEDVVTIGFGGCSEKKMQLFKSALAQTLLVPQSEIAYRADYYWG